MHGLPEETDQIARRNASGLRRPVAIAAVCRGHRDRMAARANAAVSGRDFVTPDDIKMLAVPVLEHRLILRPEFEIEGLSVPEVIQQVLQQVAVPR